MLEILKKKKLANTPSNATFQSYRDNFMEQAALAVQSEGGRIETFNHSLKGPDQESLACDAVWLGRDDASRLLVVSGGIHGVESYPGSAVQTETLKRLAAGRLPDDLGVLFIHALNPWGMAWKCRTDEHNIDPNRNFLDSYDSLPDNPGYQDLKSHLYPQGWNDHEESLLRHWLVKAWLTGRGTRYAGAITSGQYEHNNGLYFGGNSASWSRTVLESILQQIKPTFTQVSWIDVHSGLGDWGEGVILPLPGAENSRLEQECCYTSGLRVEHTEQTVLGVDHLNGDSLLAIADSLGSRARDVLTLEFGTWPPLDILMALLAQNHACRDEDGRHTGLNTAEGQQATAWLEEMFFPIVKREQWLSSINTHFDQVWKLILRRLVA